MNMNTHISFIQSTPYGPGRALGPGSAYSDSAWGAVVPGERSANYGFGSGGACPDIGGARPYTGDGRGPATGQGDDRNGFGCGE